MTQYQALGLSPNGHYVSAPVGGIDYLKRSSATELSAGELILPETENNPFDQFGQWLSQAEASEPNDPNAMILATSTPDGKPAARTVLLKAWDDAGFVFYTNLESRKSLEIISNPSAALLFYWKTLHRQIRIEGSLAPVANEEADAYFATRPRQSRIGAWASAQSQPLPNREVFEAKMIEYEAKFPGDWIPRPPNWSGWRLTPTYFEFWQDMEFRLHDRTTFVAGEIGWIKGKLYP